MAVSQLQLHGALQRLERALCQRIYVVDKRAYPDSANVEVMSSTGARTYTVRIDARGCECTCLDFSTRGMYCKHILNVLVKVLQVPAYRVIQGDVILVEVLNKLRRLERVLDADLDAVAEVRDDTDCVICYEPLTALAGAGQRQRTACGQCKHVFHAQCLSVWLRRTPTCPLCRGAINQCADSDFEPQWVLK